MGLKLSNNAVSRLAADLSNSATTISIATGEGALFPSLSAGDWFPATISNSSGNIEIVRVTARAADTFTVDRGQEGTAARAFAAGDRIEHRLTAAVLQQMIDDIALKLNAAGGTIGGNLSVTYGATKGGNGGRGGRAVRTFSAGESSNVVKGNVLTVVVGNGGNGGAGQASGTAGTDGAVYISWT